MAIGPGMKKPGGLEIGIRDDEGAAPGERTFRGLEKELAREREFRELATGGVDHERYREMMEEQQRLASGSISAFARSLADNSFSGDSAARLAAEAAARSLGGSVHVQVPPVVLPTRLEVELSPASEAAADRRAGFADDMVAAIMVRVQEFQDALADDEEVLVMLANFGQGITIHVDFILYQEPHLLIFDGADSNKRRVRLMQHAAQCNVLLASVKVAPEEERPPRRIGFGVVNG